LQAQGAVTERAGCENAVERGKHKMKDFIRITGLEVFAHHGVLEEEKKNGQDFYLNMKLFYDMKAPGRSDDLKKAVNYAEVCAFATEVFSNTVYDLIEAAAEHLCTEILFQYPLVQEVELELCKPHAPIGLPFENVSVNMCRGWHTAYLAVGSNLGDSAKLIEEAVQKIKNHRLNRNVKASDLIVTKPYGPVEQDDFLNGCIRVETLLEPEALLDFLHQIEAEADRKREIHWGPRTLDLDIIFFDRLVYESDALIIPHVDMQNREFVLKPLMQLCPNYRHPLLGRTVEEMYRKLK
jgi:dihydroneopterin aldolase/2-amino-4-hydroxy-6-hydroxymethyldihydropteridine diphosphokinase